MKQKLLLSAIIMIATFLSSTSVAQNLDPVAGEKSGFFSIGRNTKARFSQGNLQYQASTGTWRFAEHQWDYVGSPNPRIGSSGGTVTGSDNANISSTYSGWIDLFGWGTSGYHDAADSFNTNYYPYSTSMSTVDTDYNYYGYGPSTNMTDPNLVGASANYDWGVYNAISNGGNAVGLWRTLTQSEWYYMLFNRSASTVNGTANARYAKATVSGVAGVILFPDSYTHPGGVTQPTNINSSGANFTGNNYSASDWSSLEGQGAVFLPAAGNRHGSNVYSVGAYGYYWSSSCSGNSSAYLLHFYINNLRANYSNENGRVDGFSVRLVRGYPCNSASTEVINACNSYTWHGRTFTASTDTATYTTTNVAGCDSLVTLNLTVNYSNTGTDVQTACDSYTWIDGVTYTASNTTAHDTLVNAAGCDSIVTLNLTMNYRTDTAYTQIACDSFIWSTTTYDLTTTPTGAINGQFSVGENSQVYISQGNLQYQASTGTWRFAEHQYDYIGNAAGNNTASGRETQSGWIDLFGWGTSGWNNGNVYYQPYSTANTGNSSNGYGYGPTDGSSYSYNLTGDYAHSDWGVHNAISNGGNAAGQWRTLTYDEWYYLLYTRTNASSKAGYATVAGIHGVILLPDSFTDPMKNNGSGAFVPRATTGWNANVYTAENWTAMQTAGAVFLPASGARGGTRVFDVGDWATYYSSSYNGNGSVFFVHFSSSVLETGSYLRNHGWSVRLVRGYNSTETSDTYNSTGTYYHSYTAANGCPSVDTLHLTIHSSTAYTDVQTACDNLTWIDGVTYTASNSTAKDTLVNAAGCDSIVTLNLTINHCSTTVTTACDSLVWNGTTYRTDGTYKHGTDTLILTVNHSTTGTETITACNQYTWHGTNYTTSTTTPTYTTTNAAGCDSVVTLHLTINHCSTTVTTACDSLVWNGTTYRTDGTYKHGTDTLILTVNHSTTGTETVTACNQYTWHGRTFTASTDTAMYTTTNAAGCDSVVTLHLTINHCSTTEIAACGNLRWHNTTYSASGTYTDGNDTLILTINHSTTGSETVAACNSYEWHGRTFTASVDTAKYTTVNAAGCDSVVTLHLTINHDSSRVFTAEALNSYTWVIRNNSHTYTQSGTYIDRYTTVHGCSGTDTLHLTITASERYYNVRVASNNTSWGRAYLVSDSRVQHGRQGVVRVTPNRGYRFSHWSDGSTASPYAFTVTQDTLLVAYFEPATFTVTLNNGNPGCGIVSGSGTVNYGSRHNIAAAPNYGYRFIRWDDGDINAHRTITVTADVTLTAYFGTRQFSVSALPANYAHGTVTGGGNYDYQSIATLTATPNGGYEFDHWSDGETLNPRRITVTRDTVLTAVFRMVPVIPTHTVTVVSANPAMGSVIGGGTYDEGAVAAIAAIANSGCEFTGWTDGSTANPRMITVTGDTTFTARFRQIPTTPTYTITVTSNDAAMGRVSGSGTYDEGATVYLGAYPTAHCHFLRWSDGSTEANRSFAASGNLSLTALFVRDSIVITARANDDRMGRVTGGGSYAYGSSATLTATPLSGYRFVRWSTGERTTSITVTVRNATSYTAFFERTTQGVDEAEGESVRVWSHGLTIHVAGLTGEPLRVYDVTGRLVAERTAAHGDMVIPVTHPGLYLVQTGTTTHKVLTR